MSKLDMTVNLSPSDIRQAIKEYVKKELAVIVAPDDIRFDVELEINDRQPGDRGTPRLKGASVKVKRTQTGGTLM